MWKIQPHKSFDGSKNLFCISMIAVIGMIRKWDAFRIELEGPPTLLALVTPFSVPPHSTIILMLAFHWGTPPTTNERARRLNVGNDHLILANHTCCECIKWNGGVICIFRISTTSTLAQNDATVAPMTELWFSDRPQNTKWHKTDCWWMIEGGGGEVMTRGVCKRNAILWERIW